MIFLLFTAVLFLWLIRRHWKVRRILKLSRALRSKYTAWPIIGHGLMLLGGAEGRMQTAQKFGREAINNKHGATSFWLGSKLSVLTCDSAIVEIVSKSCLEKPREVAAAANQILQNSSIFAPVNIWRPRRKIASCAFSTKNLRSFVQVFAEQSMVFTDCLKSKAGKGTFSIWENITTYTMDSVFYTIFGTKIETQKQPSHPFLTALNKCLNIIPICLLQPSLPWEWLFEHIPVPIFREFKRNKKILHAFIKKVIMDKLDSLQDKYNDMDTHTGADAHNHSQSAAFLEHLIKLSTAANNGTHKYTKKELREETLLFLVAGNDTSAVGTSFTTIMLSRHADIQQKAYEEVRSIFGDSKRFVTYEDLHKLKYVEALIKESLRLYPPVPIIVRDNQENTEIASGMVAPAGTYTIINIWGIHRNPKYWGDDAEQFNPDRFLNGSPVDGAAYMPFSYGPRNCLGYKYAMMSMKVVVATLLREYKVLPPSEMSPENLKKPLRLEYKIMMKDVDNFKVRLEHRK